MLAGSVAAQQPAAELVEPTGPEPGVSEGQGDPLLIEQHIRLGDKAFGIIDGGGEVHRYTFQAVDGTRIFIKGRRQNGLMQLAFRLTDPNGAVLVEYLESVKSPFVAKRKRIKLEVTGTYTLEFTDLLNNGGTYTMRTKPDWPQRSPGFAAVDGKNPAAPTVVEGVADARLRKLIVRTLKPKGIHQEIGGLPNNLTPAVQLMDPQGNEVPFGGNVKTGKKGKKVTAWKVSLPLIGSYELHVSGANETQGYAKVLMKLRFPKGGMKHNLND